METELFDRYVHEVGRRLPRKLRADVEAELHSSLLDTLQSRMAEREGQVASEGDQIAILEEFGPPDHVAAQYAPPHRYLIGPRVFDLYLVVVAAVAGSITLVCLLLLALTMWGETDPWGAFLPSLGEMFQVYVGWLFSGLGSITLTFAILERVLPETTFDTKDEEAWDPRTLPEIQDRERVKVGELIVASSLSVIALIVFNFLPEWIIGVGFVGTIEGSPVGWHTIPLLSPAFSTTYLPSLNVLWILSIGLNVVLLRRGRWERLTRLADCVLTAWGGFILYRMVVGPSVVSLQAITSESLRQLLDSFLPGLIKVGFAIGLVVTVGEVIHKLYLTFRTKPQTFPGQG